MVENIEYMKEYIKELEDENDALKNQLLLINSFASFIIKTSIKFLENYEAD